MEINMSKMILLHKCFVFFTQKLMSVECLRPFFLQVTQ